VTAWERLEWHVAGPGWDQHLRLERSGRVAGDASFHLVHPEAWLEDPAGWAERLDALVGAAGLERAPRRYGAPRRGGAVHSVTVAQPGGGLLAVEAADWSAAPEAVRGLLGAYTGFVHRERQLNVPPLGPGRIRAVRLVQREPAAGERWVELRASGAVRQGRRGAVPPPPAPGAPVAEPGPLLAEVAALLEAADFRRLARAAPRPERSDELQVDVGPLTRGVVWRSAGAVEQPNLLPAVRRVREALGLPPPG